MKKFLMASADIEILASKVYEEFANNEKCSEELRAVWLQMSKDEEAHAQSLNLAMRLSGEGLFEGVRDDCPNPSELKLLMLDILKNAKERTSSELDMLKDAVTLENKFRKFHATYALIFKDKKMIKTFTVLEGADKAHVEGLNKYIQKHKEKNRSI